METFYAGENLGIVLTTPIVISSFASTETLSFTPDNINADISLGTLSGKNKRACLSGHEGEAEKSVNLTGNSITLQLLKGQLIGIYAPDITLLAGQHSAAEVAIWSIRTGWIPVTGTWTDESRHPDTQLNYANEFDLNIKGWLLNEPNYRLGLMAGYQESRYSFTARGGSYIYSSE